MAIKVLYLSYMYKLERIFVVFNSLKTVGIYLFLNFVPIASKKQVTILDYC